MNRIKNNHYCFGSRILPPVYAAYHDREWGVPSHEDRYLFEMLILEGVQSGLSWALVLQKRDNYKKHFHNFDPDRVATMNDQELDTLADNPTLIRNRSKIRATRQNSRVFLKIQKEFGSFDRYVWGFVNHQPIVNHYKTWDEVPSSTPLSGKLAKDLKKRGMLFIGPKIIYSYMQAVGMIDDHLGSCWRRSFSLV